MPQWCVLKADSQKQYGPMLAMDVVRLASLGKVAAEDQVRRVDEPDDAWRPAAEVEELFPGGQIPDAPAPAPASTGVTGAPVGAAAALRSKEAAGDDARAQEVREIFEDVFVRRGHPGMAWGDAISQHVLGRARETYLQLRSDEELLGLADETLLNTWRRGFALTSRRLHLFNPGRARLRLVACAPRCMPYEILGHEPQQTSARTISLGRGLTLYLSARHTDPVLRFLRRARRAWRGSEE